MENTERNFNTQTPCRFLSSHINDEDELLPMVGITSCMMNSPPLLQIENEFPERCHAPITEYYYFYS